MEGTKYTLSYARSDETQEFSSAPEAGAAFCRANAEDAPRVIKTTEHGASTIARTTRCNDTLVKQLPLESDPEFTEGYRAEQELR